MDAAPVTPVLIPGNMCDARLWNEDVRAAAPGAINADTARDDTIEAMASRALGTAKGRLMPIGFSMGAIVALEMARQQPDRIVAAVLIGLNAGADLPERAEYRPVQQAKVRAGRLEQVLIEELKPNYLATANRGDADLLALLRDMGLVLGEEVFIRQSEALRKRADLRPTLAALDIPIALMCGADDALCPPQWHRRWQSLAKRPSLHIVEGAGHMLPLEVPEAVVFAIKSLSLKVLI